MLSQSNKIWQWKLFFPLKILDTGCKIFTTSIFFLWRFQMLSQPNKIWQWKLFFLWLVFHMVFSTEKLEDGAKDDFMRELRRQNAFERKMIKQMDSSFSTGKGNQIYFFLAWRDFGILKFKYFRNFGKEANPIISGQKFGRIQNFSSQRKYFRNYIFLSFSFCLQHELTFSRVECFSTISSFSWNIYSEVSGLQEIIVFSYIIIYYQNIQTVRRDDNIPTLKVDNSKAGKKGNIKGFRKKEIFIFFLWKSRNIHHLWGDSAR